MKRDIIGLIVSGFILAILMCVLIVNCNMVLYSTKEHVRYYDLQLKIINTKYNEVSGQYTFNVKWKKNGGNYFYNLTFDNFHTNKKLVKAIKENKYKIHGFIEYDRRNGEILRIHTHIKKTFFKQKYRKLNIIERKKKKYRTFDKKGVLT
jgi:hypothetical protein